MRLYTDAEAFSLDGAVVAMGMFDGCHNGHRHVLLRAKAMAARLNSPLLVYTYINHPRAFFSPKNAPGLLQSPAERAASIARLGADYLVMQPFNQEFAATPAEEFIWKLCNRFHLRGIVLGHSHSFGANREGNARFLKNVGQRTGFEVDIAETYRVGNISVHSAKIREALLSGDMRMASLMLGRSYSIGGTIMEDRNVPRGPERSTLHIAAPKGRLLPRFGVYAAYVGMEGYSWPCVVHVGNQMGGKSVLEARFIDFSGEVYEKHAQIRFFAYLHPSEKSGPPDAAQIEMDEARARELLL